MTLYTISFSPTGTSAKVLDAIAGGVRTDSGIKRMNYDVTFAKMPETEFCAEDIVIAAAPVYGGHIAPIAKSRLESLRGNDAKCIVVAVYGNRAFEKAVVDFGEFMAEKGFNVVGGAAFVGEHSYSTPSMPIAENRPDQTDLQHAAVFGKEIWKRLIDGALDNLDLTLLEDEPSPDESLANFRDFIIRYQKSQAESPKSYFPEFDNVKCDECGACYDTCPTGAIVSGTPDVNPAQCIKCCACVKACPNGARMLQTPFARPLSENFSKRKCPRWIL